VALSVILAAGIVVGVGTLIARELISLADKLPEYEKVISTKARHFRPNGIGTATRIQKVINDISAQLDRPVLHRPERRVTDVRIVAMPTIREGLESTIGPLLEPLAVGSIVIILVLFLLVHREDLSDRLIRLCGHRRICLTTKTIEEVTARISRYLVMLAVVNSGIGVCVALGLWVLGVKYAMLWGSLVAVLRFIPYLGPATAFILTFLFSIASSPGAHWPQPIGVIVLFATIEIVATYFLEPIVYGRTTGVSALGLLVAAMFWTWLWGTLGLLLSTPLTVCLAVIGKYVPALAFFGILLRDDGALENYLKFYQRLLAFDEDGAVDVVDAAAKQRSPIELFDTILAPALARAERDFGRSEIDDGDRTFIWRVIADIIDDVDGTAEPKSHSDPQAPPIHVQIAGVAVDNTSEVLVLRMLGHALSESGATMEIMADTSSGPLKLTEEVIQRAADVIVISHVPPHGFSPARYLVKRFRARIPVAPIIVGCWSEGDSPIRVIDAFKAMGASHVVFTVAEARDRILEVVRPKPPEPSALPIPEPQVVLV
jgi:predicted PurR-regulated permease PerM